MSYNNIKIQKSLWFSLGVENIQKSLSKKNNRSKWKFPTMIEKKHVFTNK